MDTQLLRTFVTIAQAGSISAAADQLGYVSSSVSDQLRRLERDLDATLVTRTSTGVALTPAGHRLLPAAERVLGAVSDLRGALDAPRRLRVGSIDTLAVQWLPGVLAAPAAAADERPAIVMNRRDVLLRALVDGECDVVFLYRPAGGALPELGAAHRAGARRLEVEVLDTDALVTVVAPAPAADHDGWLITQPGCVHRELFDRHVAPRLPALRVHAEAPTPDALRRLARQGAGRALLPSLAVAEDLADGGLVVDPAAPDVGGAVEIVAVFRPDAGPEVHRLLRRAVDRVAAG
jgi:DNA-binding transcriptional LysR family regulator